jgi:hypothetical protein
MSKTKFSAWLQLIFFIGGLILTITASINLIKSYGLVMILIIIGIVAISIYYILTNLSRKINQKKGLIALIIFNVVMLALSFPLPKTIDDNHNISELASSKTYFQELYVFEDKSSIFVKVDFTVTNLKAPAITLLKFKKHISDTLRLKAAEKVKNNFIANIKNKKKLKEIREEYSQGFQKYLENKNNYSHIQNIRVTTFIYM